MESRYNRQEIYKDVGKQGQQKLLKTNVVIIGIGAIGTTSASLVARAGFGHITLIDRDTIELNNLQRQTLFTEQDVGKPKAQQAAAHLKTINSSISIQSHNEDLTGETIEKLIPKNTTIILDCTDNLETRFIINDYAVQHNIPWVYAAGIQAHGYVMNILPNKTPCFQCIFTEPTSLETCDTIGVLNTTTTLVASIQVNEAIKIMLNNKPTQGLLKINIKTNSITTLTTKKRKNCNACNNRFLFLTNTTKDIMKFCGTGNYQIPIPKQNLNQLKEEKLKHVNVQDHKDFLQLKHMLIFSDRVLIKAKSEKEARSLVSKYIGN